MGEVDVFVHTEVPNRVVFGAGARWRLGEEVDRLAITRVVVVSGSRSKAFAEELGDACGNRVVGVLPDAVMHVPSQLAEKTAATVADLGADGIIAVGGGSAIGLAKAVARRTELAVVALPTSYSGSEMTPIWGETEGGVKTTGRSWDVKPRTVIYDVELTTSLPEQLTVTSAVNAVAHAVEALYAPDASPVHKVVAEDGIRMAVSALGRVRDPGDAGARTELLTAAWMCGTVLGSTTMGLHHKLCHLLGGRLDLPHAETHAVLLPHVMAFNLVPGGDARARADRAIGDAPAARALWDRIGTMGGPRSLSELGMERSQLAGIVDQALAQQVANPRMVDREQLTGLLSRALEGTEPVEDPA